MFQGEHSAILSTFIKLPFVNKTFVLSIFEWSLMTGFTVYIVFDLLAQIKLFLFQFDQFVVADLQGVFNFDGLISSHPIYMA